jgi:hypothetical protein
MLDCLPLEMEIEYRKLNLFGQLCRLQTNSAVKSMFLYRLSSYNVEKVCSGFIHDVGYILEKYSLKPVMQTYISSGVFPGKFEWKNKVRKVLKNHFILEWNVRTSVDRFKRFRSVHCHFQLFHLWNFSRLYPYTLLYVKSVAQLVTYLVRYDDVCNLCKQNCNHGTFADHLIMDCSETLSTRDSLLRNISKKFGPGVLHCLDRLERPEFVNTLLGIFHPEIDAQMPAGKCFHDFMKVTFIYVHRIRLISKAINDTAI